MHPDFEKYRAPAEDYEQVNFRLPKALAAKVRVLASIENDSMINLMKEATARLLEAREQQPMAAPELIQQRVENLESELTILRSFQSHRQ